MNCHLITTERINRYKVWFRFAIVVTLLWGLTAHMYCFTNNAFSHDSLGEFFASEAVTNHRIELGRFMVPMYRIIFRTGLTLPWMVGLLGMLWVALSVFMVLTVFNVRSKLTAALIAGVFSTNLTVAATAATYLHDFDCDMFALFCAVLAVFLWHEFKWGELPGALLLAVSMGLYQSYVSVAIALIIIASIVKILEEENWRVIFRKGIFALGMLVAGGAIYYIGTKVFSSYYGVPLETGDYNSLDIALTLTPALLIKNIFDAHTDCCTQIMSEFSTYPETMMYWVRLVALTTGGLSLIRLLWNRKISIPAKALCVVLVAILPVGMNVTYVLAQGMTHDLMEYAFSLVYLLVLLLIDMAVEKGQSANPETRFAAGIMRPLSIFCICVILLGNIQLSNALYLKKDFEADATLSLMTRVMYRVEDYDGYVPEETEVVFVGAPKQMKGTLAGFEGYETIVGVRKTFAIGSIELGRFRSYFKYVMNMPITLAESKIWKAMQKDVRVGQMPAYPDDGCIEMIDGVLVVKLG